MVCLAAQQSARAQLAAQQADTEQRFLLTVHVIDETCNFPLMPGAFSLLCAHFSLNFAQLLLDSLDQGPHTMGSR